MEALRAHLGRSEREGLAAALARTDPAALPAAADRAYAAPLLYQTLRRRRLLESLPPTARAALEGAALKNAARKSALLHTLEHVGETLAGVGVVALALKGAALECLAAPGPRVMADLDLMLRPADLPSGVAALTNAGYRFDRPPRQCDSYQQLFYHLAPLLSPDGLSVIELHTAPWGNAVPFPCPVEAFWSGAHLAGRGGSAVMVPSWPCLLIHTAIHDGFVHPLNTRLRRCWDVALLATETRPAAEWEAAWRLAGEIGAARVLAWALAGAAAEGVVDLPAPVGKRARRLTPRMAVLPERSAGRSNRLVQALVRASLLTHPLDRARCLLSVALPDPAEVAVQVDAVGPGGYLRHLLSLQRLLRGCRALRELGEGLKR